ncbi:MAG: hypothetical protein ABFD18_05955 [Syntrophomonas sp.]
MFAVMKGESGMSYIKAIVPMKDYRLFMEMESGSVVTVDLSGKHNTIKYAELADQEFFQTAATDGDYIIWGGGRLRLTVHELMEVVLLG